MIEIRGQYIFELRIGDMKDFMLPDDLVNFAVEETCGNNPPSFDLTFKTRESRILSKLNENSEIKLRFGETIDKFEEMELFVTDMDIDANSDELVIAMSGFTVKPDYITDTNLFISDEKSGLEVIKEVLKGKFKVVSNIDKTSDSQKWIQPNITDRNFISEVISHSYIEDSFLSSAICSDNNFIIKDMKKEVKDKVDKVDWTFTNGEIRDLNKEIIYGGNFSINSQMGIVNSLALYGREKLIHDLEKGTSSIEKYLPKPIVAMSKEFAKNKNIEHKFTGSSFLNENVHENYNKAFMNFLGNNIILGSLAVNINFGDKYRRIKPLDLVMFKATDKRDKNMANEFVSGFYFVSRVLRRITNGMVNTEVTIMRETFSGIK